MGEIPLPVPLMPHAGRRNKLVTIQERPAADAVDSGGYPVDGAWTTLGAEWMCKLDVSELGESERFRSEQIAASFDTEWVMPYRATMDPEAINVPKQRRLSYLGRTYDIVWATLYESHEGRGVRLRTLAASGVS